MGKYEKLLLEILRGEILRGRSYEADLMRI
jgi:hypothetical protein